MAKASDFMYGMIISIGIISVLAIFLSQLFTNYAVVVPAEHNKTLTLMGNISSVNVYVEEQKEQALSETEKEKTLIGEVLDILGFWFERGVKTLKLIPDILMLFEGIIGAGISSSSSVLGIAAPVLKFMIVSMATVFIVIGVLISAFLKKDV